MNRLIESHLESGYVNVHYSVFLLVFLVFILIPGCAGIPHLKSTGGTAADLLPQPGATIEVGKINFDLDKQFDFDPADLLNKALVQALKKEQLLWPGDNTPRFLFNATIVNYEPGNAFKRWVLPGWGSTLLDVRGEIQTPDSEAVAAVVENKRSVIAGGAYTINAWKSIFDNVATDLAREMKRRIHGGGFVISLSPYSEQSSGAKQVEHSLEIVVKDIRDLRPDKLRLGERTAAFKVKMSDIYANRRVTEYFTENLSDALRTMGHKVGSSARGVAVQGELLKFWIETPASIIYWDIIAEIKLRLQFKGPLQEVGSTCVYTSQAKERTYAWPSVSLIEKAVNTAVIDIMRQVQSDKIWNTFELDN